MPLTSSGSNNFSFLVDIRHRHQTKEAEKGVRRNGRTPSEGQSSVSASSSGEPVSERQLLARKIHDIVNGVNGTADLEDIGTSTGLNRQVRWTKTPGLYSPSFTHLASPTNPKSGNSANAKEVAQKAANAVRFSLTATHGLGLIEQLCQRLSKSGVLPLPTYHMPKTFQLPR